MIFVSKCLFNYCQETGSPDSTKDQSFLVQLLMKPRSRYCSILKLNTVFAKIVVVQIFLAQLLITLYYANFALVYASIFLSLDGI